MVRGLVANGLGYALMHSRPPGSRALDGRRVAYRPVREAVRPTQLGLARLAELRPTRLAESFAAFCRRQTMTGPAPISE
jgi:DNA-binding transcriptional LysR family regulator